MPNPLSKHDYDLREARRVGEEPIVGERKVHRGGTLAEINECLRAAELYRQRKEANERIDDAA